MDQPNPALQRREVALVAEVDDAPTEEEIAAWAAEHEKGGARWSGR